MEQRFIVPQFIDTEDKIFGPITVRQFIIMIIGGLFVFASYKLADFSLFITEAFIIAALTLLVAFVKVNGAPFHMFFLNFIQTFKKPKIRIWSKQEMKVEEYKSENEGQPETYVHKKKFLSSSKLSDLSLIIDTGGIYKGEQVSNQIHQTNYSNK